MHTQYCERMDALGTGKTMINVQITSPAYLFAKLHKNSGRISKNVQSHHVTKVKNRAKPPKLKEPA